MLCLSPNKVLVLVSPLGPDFGKNPLLLSSSLLNVPSLSLRPSTNPETHPFLHGAVLWIDFENGSKFCSTVWHLLRVQYVLAASVAPQDERLEMLLPNLQVRWARWTLLVADDLGSGPRCREPSSLPQGLLAVDTPSLPIQVLSAL